MRGFSVVGFFVGAICAIVFYVVFTDIVAFRHEDVVAGLGALLIWGALTFGWRGREVS